MKGGSRIREVSEQGRFDENISIFLILFFVLQNVYANFMEFFSEPVRSELELLAYRVVILKYPISNN